MDHIVHPSLALLDTEVPPLRFRHQVGFRYSFRNFFRQHYMPVHHKNERGNDQAMTLWDMT